jgi:AraC-like DNA-binding protein
MKRGRRSNLTPQLQQKICALLMRGHTVATVCGALGISHRSFHDYCARDGAFLAATQRARAQGMVRIVDSILL